MNSVTPFNPFRTPRFRRKRKRMPDPPIRRIETPAFHVTVNVGGCKRRVLDMANPRINPDMSIVLSPEDRQDLKAVRDRAGHQSKSPPTIIHIPGVPGPDPEVLSAALHYVHRGLRPKHFPDPLRRVQFGMILHAFGVNWNQRVARTLDFTLD